MQWSEVISTYTRAWFNPAFFDKGESWKLNYRLEAGIGILGEKAVLEAFGAYEQYFDDASQPYPLQSNVVYVGVRGRSHWFF